MADKRKCAKHNLWIKKGWCPMCDVEQKKLQLENEKRTGSHKPKVVIKKI